MFVRFPRSSVRPIRDTGRISIRHVSPPSGLDFLLVTAHLQSKMYASEESQLQSAIRLMPYVEEAEEKIGHSRTIVCGDFNMDPFEPAMIGAAGFHAMISRTTASRGFRTVDGEKRKFFYNPMWSFYGDTSLGPPGTYHYSRSSQVTYFWHMFDQVLFRPELLDGFEQQDLAILTEVDGRSLLTSNGTPDTTVGSDHLPILFRLNLDSSGGTASGS